MKHPVYRIALFSVLLALPAAGNPPPAAPDLQPAADRGDAEAQFQLARACLRGEGVPKDVKKGFELMKAAADQGHAEAIGGLGYFYKVGLAVAKDEKQAAEWFRKGAEKGSAKARLNLAKMLLNDKADSGKALESVRAEGLQLIKQAADQGLIEAAVSYGSILYFGDHGVDRDYTEAARYFKAAADQGNPDAQNFLGSMSELGGGVSVDTVLAEQWFRKAALQGNVKAQGNLGRMLNPLADDRDKRIEALAWLVLAWQQGEVTAQKSLEDAGPGLKEGEFEDGKARAAELRKQIR